MDSGTENASIALIERLGHFVGLQGMVDGHRVEWIDVLEEGPSVVLQDLQERSIQASQYARPTHRQARIFTVPACSAQRSGLHPVLRELLPEKDQAALEALVRRICDQR